eukprot:TRINITY_DN50433_c0_g1_i1.p1 TRINITY_DN50433_c0_g1~~TRINITY_DN50433_c0_g1_i1.p1  ORF type:complete len:373 (+),score=23.39 TRINITY_DN50433_c0_g1_i1:84-1202(+)
MVEQPDPKRFRSSSSAVVLNVGGKRFTTSLQTLRSCSSSYFGALFSGRHRIDLDDEDGSLFVDRSPKHFAFILEYLRNGKETPLRVETDDDLDELRLEAEYYGLTHLARSCRRFKLLDQHFISQVSSKSGSFTVVRGMHGAAAMFDVQDPDHFEVTFAGRGGDQKSNNDFSDLFQYLNGPAVMLGLVPKDVDLSAEWEPHANPLPVVNPGPFDTDVRWHCGWAPPGQGRFPIDPSDASRYWPQEVRLPPSLRHGIACVITVSLFQEPMSKASTNCTTDGYLSRFIVGGSLETGANLAKWWAQLPESVAMRFSRSREQCRLDVIISDDDDTYHDYELDLVSLGLDPKLPYRPVIFFGVRAMVDVANDYNPFHV